MKTYYIKRYQVHRCDQWGIQVSSCYTQLLRATSRGKHHPIIWEWVRTGQRLTQDEVIRMMQRYPVCELQDDDDLTRRAMQRYKKMAQKSIARHLTFKISGSWKLST